MPIEALGEAYNFKTASENTEHIGRMKLNLLHNKNVRVYSFFFIYVSLNPVFLLKH